MRIAIIGLGKTGALIRDCAVERQHEVVTVDATKESADFASVAEAPIADCDCCIDFTHPDAIMGTIDTVLKAGTPLVVGTTGWYEKIDTVKGLVDETKTPFLYASNFSIGVHLFSSVLKYAAALFNAFEDYDVAGFELHHNQKADSPSGTARTVAEILLAGSERKDSIVYGAPDRKIENNELHFSSVRCGNIPGTHEAIFDSEFDSIRIQHAARSRMGFALGAVQAAEWLQGKTGFYSIDDLIDEALAGASL